LDASLDPLHDGEGRIQTTVPGEILTVRAPGIDETVATGFADVDAQTPLEPDTPFRVASMTKTFVAAAVLRLVEEKKLRLDDPITRHLAPETLDVLRADGYERGQSSVRWWGNSNASTRPVPSSASRPIEWYWRSSNHH
jgi:CubicO group peptidase (beta-lactamase class C family)